MKKYLKYVFVFLALGLTLLLWLLSLHDAPNNSLLSLFARAFALMGVTLLMFEFILTTKLRILEDLFDGMDKIYRFHHFVGGFAFSFMLSHPAFLVLNSLDNLQLARNYIVPFKLASYSYGILALYLFTVLLLLTLFIKLPYKWWKLSHNLMGVPLLLAMVHVLLIESDVSRFTPLKIWVIFMLSVALLAFLYTRVLYHFIGPRFKYEIIKLNTIGAITEIYLKPIGKKLIYKPGQFVFLQKSTNNLITKLFGEKHPFSISSGDNEDFLRLSIKKSGDFTQKLDSKLTVGMEVTLFGPYGRFSEKWLTSKKDAIWIAGGIGITPFLSMLESQNDSIKSKSVKLFYVTRNNVDNFYDAEIKNKIQEKKNVEYYSFLSNVKGRITAANIEKQVPDLLNRQIFICGPFKMMMDLKDQFQHLGIKPNNIIFEDFDLK